MQPYAPELEQTMRQFYNSLSEKDRRHYAGVEALKLGQGGRKYIARILGGRRRTVTKGAKEISGWVSPSRLRRLRRAFGKRVGAANRTRRTGPRLMRSSGSSCTITPPAIR